MRKKYSVNKNIDLVYETTQTILDHIGVSPRINVTENVQTNQDGSQETTYDVLIEGRNLNFLIGYHGQSLDGFQTILTQIVSNKFDKWTRVTVDINDYRKARFEKIEDMVRDFVDRVRFSQQEVEMHPMNPFERRQVHMIVAEYTDIVSESTGEGLERRIVLSLSE